MLFFGIITSKRKKCVLVIFGACLLVGFLNNFGIFYFFSRIFSKDCKQQQQQQQFFSPNQISILFDVNNIYRIDTSCDFVTKDLGQRVSKVYADRTHRCSRSSLKQTQAVVDRNLIESLNKTAATAEESYEYKADMMNPKYLPVSFDPFDGSIFQQRLLSKTWPQWFSYNDNNTNGTIKNKMWTPNLWSKTRPPPCKEQDLDEIVFVVPYSSSRLQNLKQFLPSMHAYLRTAQRPFKYRILVVEQQEKRNLLFNKGRLINMALVHALRVYPSLSCVVLHDVDIIPARSSRALGYLGDYRCKQMPLHMTLNIFLQSTGASRLYNRFLTGGVLSARPGHYRAANGYSNRYFGWGAEDDDWSMRLFNKKICLMRPENTKNKLVKRSNSSNSQLTTSSPFIMLKHRPSRVNKKRHNQLATSLINQQVDGLSNVERLARIIRVRELPLMTHLLVDVVKSL